MEAQQPGRRAFFDRSWWDHPLCVFKWLAVIYACLGGYLPYGTTTSIVPVLRQVMDDGPSLLGGIFILCRIAMLILWNGIEVGFHFRMIETAVSLPSLALEATVRLIEVAVTAFT